MERGLRASQRTTLCQVTRESSDQTEVWFDVNHGFSTANSNSNDSQDWVYVR